MHWGPFAYSSGILAGLHPGYSIVALVRARVSHRHRVIYTAAPLGRRHGGIQSPSSGYRYNIAQTAPVWKRNAFMQLQGRVNLFPRAWEVNMFVFFKRSPPPPRGEEDFMHSYACRSSLFSADDPSIPHYATSMSSYTLAKAVVLRFVAYCTLRPVELKLTRCFKKAISPNDLFRLRGGFT